MPSDPRKARDLALLDALDAFPREAFSQRVWRVVRAGCDPLQGARSHSRWCNDGFQVLYASLERKGALAEIHALLASQPVFPSKIQFFAHRLSVRTSKILHLADLAALARLGIDIARYRERVYQRTQEIADAAYFLGFDGLIAPSARSDGHNLVLFTERIPRANLALDQSEETPIDSQGWRKRAARRR